MPCAVTTMVFGFLLCKRRLVLTFGVEVGVKILHKSCCISEAQGLY